MIDYNYLGEKIYEYCKKYKIPLDFIFEILNDQKVVPMIRGKATEFNVFVLLSNLLNNSEWTVQKLNLNAQPGTDDEDISITHKRTGIIIKVECKNAVRESMSSGKRSRVTKSPHCRIKSHKSRSNTKKMNEGNDRYTLDSFDIIISNISNAIIKSASIDENFELIDDAETVAILAKHYNVNADFDSLFTATSDDWRFVLTKNIAEGNLLPRTPVVLLSNDPNWKPLECIEESLLELVKEKRQLMRKERKHN